MLALCQRDVDALVSLAASIEGRFVEPGTDERDDVNAALVVAQAEAEELIGRLCDLHAELLSLGD